MLYLFSESKETFINDENVNVPTRKDKQYWLLKLKGKKNTM